MSDVIKFPGHKERPQERAPEHSSRNQVVWVCNRCSSMTFYATDAGTLICAGCEVVFGGGPACEECGDAPPGEWRNKLPAPPSDPDELPTGADVHYEFNSRGLGSNEDATKRAFAERIRNNPRGLDMILVSWKSGEITGWPGYVTSRDEVKRIRALLLRAARTVFRHKP